MTTMWQVHKRLTFTAIGFTPRFKDTFEAHFDDKQEAMDYCESLSYSDFNPMSQDMTTVFYYIMKVKL